MLISTLWRRAAVLGGAVVLMAAAALAGGAHAQSKDDLLLRLQELDAEIAEIRARLGVTPGATAPGGDAGALESELRRLTARLEQVERAQRELHADLSRRLGDIEYRLNDLEGVPNEGTPTPLAGDPTAETEPETTTAPAASVSERNRLDQAIVDVKNGRFDQAEDRLRRFMREYPDSPLIGEAWYWLGESQSVRGVHAEAAKSFLAGFNANPNGPYAAENMFRTGTALGELGQINEACLTLYEVKSRFATGAGDVLTRADRAADELSCI